MEAIAHDDMWSRRVLLQSKMGCFVRRYALAKLEMFHSTLRNTNAN